MGVEEGQQDLVLGHPAGKVGSDYGSESIRLKVAKRALEAALRVREGQSRGPATTGAYWPLLSPALLLSLQCPQATQ